MNNGTAEQLIRLTCIAYNINNVEAVSSHNINYVNQLPLYI